MATFLTENQSQTASQRDEVGTPKLAFAKTNPFCRDSSLADYDSNADCNEAHARKNSLSKTGDGHQDLNKVSNSIDVNGFAFENGSTSFLLAMKAANEISFMQDSADLHWFHDDPYNQRYSA